MRPHDGVGGAVPRPRKDSPASASTASAYVTELCTMTSAPMFGSTCRHAIAHAGRFAARAAST
jgi:hypothetical protein